MPYPTDFYKRLHAHIVKKWPDLTAALTVDDVQKIDECMLDDACISPMPNTPNAEEIASEMFNDEDLFADAGFNKEEQAMIQEMIDLST